MVSKTVANGIRSSPVTFAKNICDSFNLDSGVKSKISDANKVICPLPRKIFPDNICGVKMSGNSTTSIPNVSRLKLVATSWNAFAYISMTTFSPSPPGVAECSMPVTLVLSDIVNFTVVKKLVLAIESLRDTFF